MKSLFKNAVMKIKTARIYKFNHKQEIYDYEGIQIKPNCNSFHEFKFRINTFFFCKAYISWVDFKHAKYKKISFLYK